jgi:2-polyprenyl-3-methyl-5-hydroxy-6-metoxy-1,4-benzoquinol methylase
MFNEPDLTKQESHFSFGKNWAAYAKKISEVEIEKAIQDLSRLLHNETLDGKRFLDIGSGSGLHSLAALRLGAREVVTVDIDPDSIATTRAVLERYAPKALFHVEQASIFDLDQRNIGLFDVVYSWGVLHHTGDMMRAVRIASSLVAPGCLFIFALYRRIWTDGFWKREKRWYARASTKAQARARLIYIFLFQHGLRLKGRDFEKYVMNYSKKRGMDFFHDVHDWLGGWPYESISFSKVEIQMASLDFLPIRVFAPKRRLLGAVTEVFGSGCNEYVYRHNTGVDP